MKNEADWKSQLRKAFDTCGAQSLSLHGHGMQAPGWPDLWIGHHLWKGWIELKMWNGEVSTPQRIIGRKLEKIGSFFVLRATKDKLFCRLEDHDGKVYNGADLPILGAREILERLAW
mgnify:CR=1 FL=1